jgi:hypothetical protein
VPRRNSRGGRSAAEHLIAALRCLYKHAEDDGLINPADNPARKVEKPRRLPSTRRAVADTRLARHHDRVLPAGPGPGPGPAHRPRPYAARRHRTRPRDEGTGPPPGPARTRPGHPRTRPRALGHPPAPVLPPGQQRSRGRTTAPARGPMHRVRPGPARHA